MFAMDNFDWEMINSPTATRSSNFVLPLSAWSNCDILTGSSSIVEDFRCSMSEKVDLNPSLLSSLLGHHETAPRATGVVEVAAPPLCSFDGSLDLDLLQYQEVAARLLRAADSAPPIKSQVGMASSREHSIPSKLHASFSSTNGPMIGSPASCLTESFVPSAANSEDDLSAIFYSCSANISSTESDMNLGGSLDQLHQHSGCVEVASQSSSNPKWPPQARRSKGVGVKRLRNSGESARIAGALRPKSSGKGGGGIQLSFRSALSMSKKVRRTWPDQKNSSIDFGLDVDRGYKPDMEAIAQVKEMMYMTAALRPVNLGLEEPMEMPKRKNVKISSDPQTVAARHRRERISERLRVLQKLVPGGNKMDTASMLDEAANYLKFLKSQVRALENIGTSISNNNRLDMAVNNEVAAASTVAPVTTYPFPLPLNHRRQAFPMQHLFHSPKP